MKERPKRPRVVIIGGGFGGLYAAKALSNAAVAVALIDRKNHHTFQPLLYQVALAVLSPGEIASPLRHILRKALNVHTLLAEVAGFNTAARRVTARRFCGLDPVAVRALTLRGLSACLAASRRIRLPSRPAFRFRDGWVG